MRSTQPIEAEPVRQALNLMAHRGPDGQGVWARPAPEAPFVALGHRRLAIIDLSDDALQPMSDGSGQFTITFNGEIYNYLELLDELKGLGASFRTKSDTEVLLWAYRIWGPDCVTRLNGMFAFAIWDERRRELFAARDRFGEKPFHYAWTPDQRQLAFASEIKSLLAYPDVPSELNERSLYRYAAFKELAGSTETLWKHIYRLPPAHWLRASCREHRLQLVTGKYWDIDLQQESSLDLASVAKKVAELFADSVRLRLRADVPVGTSLSGGVDSSAVVCQIHALGAAAGQKTFSARMEDPALDEGQHIATVISKTGVEGHEIWPTASVLRARFEKLCLHQEEPVGSTSQFAQHLVMMLAQQNGVIVLLDGQGADEQLAGYKPYYMTRYMDLAEHWQVGTLLSEWWHFRKLHRQSFPVSPRAAMARMFPRVYRAYRAPLAANDSLRWWNPDWCREFKHEERSLPSASKRDALTNALYHDSLGGPLQELLRYGDRNSMAWSREVRQPFLDHRLAELLFSLPPKQKLLHGETKVVFRKAMRGLVPDSILDRKDKLGYQAPLLTWLKGELFDWTGDKLALTAEELNGRLAPGCLDSWQRLGTKLDAGTARGAFSLITLGQSLQELRTVAAAAAACL